VNREKVNITKGRGAISNPANRYETNSSEGFDDGWELEEELPKLKTTLTVDTSRSAITYNDSPDVPFDRTINPYRGCEHGCIYCYARPGHAWLGHSPGLDFESRLYYKPELPELLRMELASKSYECAPVALGAATDAYQPVEQRLGLSRRVLKQLQACDHPLVIMSKSALVERDIDLLSAMANKNQVRVMISLTTLDARLARRLEPRAAAPRRRLETIRRLQQADIQVGVLVAPVIPMLTDSELETLMAAGRDAGADTARYELLRLPLELGELFTQWLEQHYPDQTRRVLNRIRDTREGELYRSDFASRMTGTGDYAGLIAQRFLLAWKKLGYSEPEPLNCRAFVRPAQDPRQMALF
jgi:DNA repair photolyase